MAGLDGGAAPAMLFTGILLCWRWRDWRLCGAPAVSLIGGVVLYTAIKPLVGRAQPPEDFAVGTYPGLAFPSGHATQAIAFYGVLGFPLARRARSLRWVWITVAAVVTLVVGASRVYLGAHWLTDVLGGYALGGCWLALVIAAYESRSSTVAACTEQWISDANSDARPTPRGRWPR